MRKQIVAANWKMNLTPTEGVQLIKDITTNTINVNEDKKVVLCVPFTHLHTANEALNVLANPNILLGAQNCYFAKNGAFTGEISIDMLQSFNNMHAIIVGHSERRMYFAETNDMLKQKVDAILNSNLTPIFCCGEPLDIRNANTQNQYVETQLLESILHLNADDIQNVVIAYEPIWAIGTGVTASTAQAQEMHQHIRGILSKKYSEEVANEISILYGGSCNATNAQELFACTDVDGGLIGGAALKADQFVSVVAGMG